MPQLLQNNNDFFAVEQWKKQTTISHCRFCYQLSLYCLEHSVAMMMDGVVTST